RREGWRVNRKRGYRLWRRQGLKIPKKLRKKRRLGTSANGCTRRRGGDPGHRRWWGIVREPAAGGKATNGVRGGGEDNPAETGVGEVWRGLTAGAVIAVLAAVIGRRGAPRHIRSDNGPEFVAKAIRAWLAKEAVGPLYIAPGAPWENGYAESFHSRLRDEFLDAEEFASLVEARGLAQEGQER